MQCFGGPPDLLLPWADRLFDREAFCKASGSFYLGFLRRRPVSAGRRFVTNGVVGVYHVGTLAEFRGWGFGRAITSRIVADGKKEGGSESFLQSTRAGLPLYEKLGYRRVEEYRQWIRETPPPI